MDRSLEPELLDTLPPDHPDALRNRRDLRLTNLVMRNHAWFARTLPRLVRPGERILEVGAGTGELGRRLSQAGLSVDGLDFWPRPGEWPAHAHWYSSDLRTFNGYAAYHVVIGNLILHQFSDEDLLGIGRLISGARLIVACEPTRRRLSQVLYRLIAPLFGANEVTLHDAHVSIAGGFLNNELPDALGLDASRWETACTPTTLGAYHMVGRRRDE